MTTHFIAFFRSRQLIVCLLACACWMSVPSAFAVVDIYEFDSESQRERYFQLSEELRCPKCQNQNLAGSDSQIAGDLRRELRRLLAEGKTDNEIKGFMVDRYGEFVLYSPRLQKSTLVLWGLPILLLFFGVGAIWMIAQRKKDMPTVDQGSDGGEVNNSLNPEERLALDELLKKDTSSQFTTQRPRQATQQEELK
ncbi:MAG: cytochrome c-type biogenesis protein CcmH [Candidatus Endobugula sp.]|jgi:cytochrome c-type biogenesis protein CcmH